MEQNAQEKALKGYKTIIVIMGVVLVVLAGLYFAQTHALREDEKYLETQRDTLTSQLSTLMTEYDGLKVDNEEMGRSLEIERQKADSLMQRLTKERSFSASKIRKYEKELGTLRMVMKNYVRQIDSLNNMNKALAAENLKVRKEAAAQRQRAESAEEANEELNSKVRLGALLKARDIKLLALTKNDKEVSKAARAARLRVDMVVAANDLAAPGKRDIYVRILGPEGYVLAESATAQFDFEGEKMTYSAMRSVDYQNQELPVSIFYNGTGIVSGKYQVSVYIDGMLVGTVETILR